MNVQQEAELWGALFAARTQTHTFSDGHWPILCLCGSEVEAGCFMSRFVRSRARGVEGVLWWWKSHHVFTFTLAFSHPWLPRMPLLPGSLEVCWVCFHTQGADGRGETKLRLWVWGCVFVCLCTRCLSVQEKENWGRGKKSTWPADRAVFSKIHQQEEKKTRGKNNKSKKQKNNPPAYILSLPLKPVWHSFVENKPEREYDTNSSVANLFIESGDSNGIREIRGNHMRKIHKSLRREEPVFPSYNAMAEEDMVRSATQLRSVL